MLVALHVCHELQKSLHGENALEGILKKCRDNGSRFLSRICRDQASGFRLSGLLAELLVGVLVGLRVMATYHHGTCPGVKPLKP